SVPFWPPSSCCAHDRAASRSAGTAEKTWPDPPTRERRNRPALSPALRGRGGSGVVSGRGLTPWPDESGLVCQHDGLHAVSRPGLREDPADIGFHRRFCEVEGRGKLGIRQATADE